MNRKIYFQHYDDFDKESKSLLLGLQNKILTETPQQSNSLSKVIQPSDKINSIPASSSEVTGWITDEYINLEKLIVKIKAANSGMNNYQFIYYPQELESNTENKSIQNKNNGFIQLKVYRNPKAGNVSVKWKDSRITQKIDPRTKKIYYRLHFYYVNSQETAFILETSWYQDFRDLNILLNYGDVDKYEADYNYFLQNFADALRDEKDAERLKFIYENIPETLLSNISHFVDNEVFFEHLEILSKDDDSDIFRDSSTAVVQVFKAFGNPIPILNYFRENPAKLNRIYYNLDKSSEHNDKLLSNRMILANILMVFSMFSKNTKQKKTAKTFTIGKGYKINSNIMEGGIFQRDNDNYRDTFFLQQQKEEQQNVKVIPKEVDPNEQKTVVTDLDDGAQYHPLDMVYLIDISSEKEISYFVPAIYVKVLADEQEWQVTLQNIRIAADIVAVIIGVLTLPAGNPYFLLLAIADISLAGADITIQAFKEEILKYEGGKEFLEDWEKLYVYGGSALVATNVVGGFYLGAARLLTKIAEGEVKNYLKSIVIKAILEINISSFTKDSIRIIEPEEIFLGVEYKALGEKMTEKGVIFIGGKKDGKFAETFEAVYDGEIIEEFSKAETSKFYKKWGKLKDEKLEETLEEVSQTLKYENGRIGYVEGLYGGIDINYKPKAFGNIEDIEDYDPKYGGGIVTRFENYNGYFYRNFDGRKKIFTFNHGFLEDLPKWVEDVKIPLVKGKGIPSQAYFTLRQMKLLKIGEGEIQTVRMSQIQNLETMGYIHQVTEGKIVRNFDSIDILAAPSNEYMKTVMTQAGYETVSGRITGKGQYFSIKELKRNKWNITDEFMQKYNLSENSMLYMNFNIEVKLNYTK
ncbi:hypothetical protein [Chryseobacterium lathyri]|uniref:Uncharacterized protein n=1 Tax=Chryseobacterium lathyri TaxID=395933 RepID=A0ABT9SGJ0_9FLAO|nr:hypothetical protein [Chryseobacterium lathyri]MDP9958537.1 hypothetical protein [Chryseobacterium lathyri]